MRTLQFRRLRTQLTLALLLVAIVPLAVVSTMIYRQRVEAIREEAFAKLQVIRDIKVQQLNGWLDERLGDIEVLSSVDVELHELALLLAGESTGRQNESVLQEVQDFLQEHLEAYSAYEEMLVIGAGSGTVVVSTDRSHIGQDHSADAFFSEPVRTGDPFVQDIYFSKLLQRPSMVFSAPIMSLDSPSTVAGVLVARIGLERSLYDLLLNRTGMGETGETLIVNQDGVALNELRWQERAPLRLTITAEPTKLAAEGKTGITEIEDYRGERVLAAYTHIERMKWGFVAKQDLVEVYSPIRMMVLEILLLFCLAVVAVTGFSFYLAGTIVRPILAMADVAARLGKGELLARNRITRQNELGSLAQAFNTMADSMGSQMKVEQGRAEITESTSASTELSELPHLLLRALMDATGSALGAFYLRSGDGKSFVHVASIGAIRELREPFDADTFEGEFGTALATERICHIKDIPEETRFVFKTVAGRRSRKRS